MPAGRAAGRRSTASPPTLREALERRRGAHRGLPPHPAAAPSRATSATASSIRVAAPCPSTGPAATCPAAGPRYPSTVLMTAVPAKVAGVARGRAVRAARPATGSVPDVDPGRRRDRRRRRGVPRSAAPRPSAPWPTAPSPIAPVDVIVGPGQRLRRRGQARGGAARARRRAVGVRRAVARSWSWPTTPRRPSFAAIDVIVQAEHGPDGLAWLVTWDEAVADAVDRRRSPRWSPRRPARADIEATLADGGYAVLVDGPEQADGGRQRHRPRAPRAA